MHFEHSAKVRPLIERLTAFMEAHVYPAEAVFEEQVNEGDRWQPTAIMEELKAKAKALGQDTLAFYDLFAPLPGASKSSSYSFAEAKEIIVTEFGRFSQALGDFAGAWVARRVVRIDGAAGVQRLEVVGKSPGIDRLGPFIGIHLRTCPRL